MNEQVKFNLLKYNRHGKKQQRTLLLSEKGIVNKDGSKTKWERPPAQIHSIHVSESEPRGFVIQLIDSYRFETETPEQVKQIVDTFRQLGLGEVVIDQALPASTDDDAGRQSASGPGLQSSSYITQSLGPGLQNSAPPQPGPRPVRPDVSDEQDYAQSSDLTASGIGLGHQGGLNPLAQFRFERPQHFPVPAPSGPRLMKPQNFELVSCLGRGSFGEVFLVRRVDDSRFFAMKVLKKRQIIDRRQLEHLNAEHIILQAMRHPYMVQLFHSFQTRTRLFLVMDFALGGEMFHHLKRVGRFPEALAVFYLAEVLDAFKALHDADIVFRDTKPENILLDARGHVLLADFGLARTGVSAPGAQQAGAAATTFCGTPDYLAAEVLAGVPYGRSVDVWAAGALLFEMLVGKAPFSFGARAGQGRQELYRRILRGALAFPPGISAEARDFVQRCLQRRPHDRPALDDLFRHKIFAKHGIDFQKIRARTQEPPQRIRVDESAVKAVEGRLLPNKGDNIYRYVLPDTLVANFDPRFTKEQPTLAASQKQDAVTEEEDRYFKDFNWTAPWAFDPVQAK